MDKLFLITLYCLCIALWKLSNGHCLEVGRVTLLIRVWLRSSLYLFYCREKEYYKMHEGQRGFSDSLFSRRSLAIFGIAMAKHPVVTLAKATSKFRIAGKNRLEQRLAGTWW